MNKLKEHSSFLYMAINIFKPKILSRFTKGVQPSSVGTVGEEPKDDDTVISNFTDTYLEAYFDGELEVSEERYLEGVLGEKYIQDEMVKRGELRNIISRQSVLSIPSAHALKQEKKRVWNEIEHELKASLGKRPVASSHSKPIFNFRSSVLKSFAVGTSCLLVGLVYINSSSERSNFDNTEQAVRLATSQFNNQSNLSRHESAREYVLAHPREMSEMLRLLREEGVRTGSPVVYSPVVFSQREVVGGREIRDFERQNSLIANLNNEELSDLGNLIVRGNDSYSNNLTMVSYNR
jgi:hypothetical protein